MPLAISVSRKSLMRSRSNAPPLDFSDFVWTSGIQREPQSAISVAGINGSAIAPNVFAWPIWSIRNPVRSGPVKLADREPQAYPTEVARALGRRGDRTGERLRRELKEHERDAEQAHRHVQRHHRRQHERQQERDQHASGAEDERRLETKAIESGDPPAERAPRATRRRRPPRFPPRTATRPDRRRRAGRPAGCWQIRSERES